MIKGSIALPEGVRIDSHTLDKQISDTIGPDIAWVVTYDENKQPISVHYEYPADAGYDPAKLAKLVTGHRAAPEEDDFTKSQKAAMRDAQRSAKIDEILANWDRLLADVASLKEAKGK